MPPHCDAMDGPVVKAAMRVPEEENVDIILPYVPREGEEKVRVAFRKVIQVRKGGGAAREVADLYYSCPPSPVRGGSSLHRVEAGRA